VVLALLLRLLNHLTPAFIFSIVFKIPVNVRAIHSISRRPSNEVPSTLDVPGDLLVQSGHCIARDVSSAKGIFRGLRELPVESENICRQSNHIESGLDTLIGKMLKP